MIPVAGAAVEFQRRIIAAVNFEMNGVDAHFERFLFDESNGLAAKAAAAMIRSNVQFVDKGIVAVELEAEAYGQDDIADDRRAVVEEPYATEGIQRQELTKGRANSGFVKLDSIGFMFVESAHHWHKSGFVLQRRFTKLQWEHVIHRFVR